jgi:IMP cyclohydrolase
MPNPNGPYPGRQLFVGSTRQGHPCFAYLITGRSPESRQRRAAPVDNTVRIGPSGDAPYDPLRHYSAVKFDDITGTLAVSNGIQTEAVYEVYRLLTNVASPREERYLQYVMEGAKAEPDSYHTPRIAACLFPAQDGNGFACFAGIKAEGAPARVYPVPMQSGTLSGLSVYKGDLAKPEARDPNAGLTALECEATSPQDLAAFLFDLSVADYEGNDIRVCAVGGVWVDAAWKLAVRNK